MNLFKTTFLVGLLGFGMVARAGTFCVSNSTMLETVLDIAESNGQDDVIKVVTGNYIPLNDYGFRFYLGENYDIEISGSWSVGCEDQSLNPLDTILDGDDSKRVIGFYSTQSSPFINAKISLSVMSVNNGLHHEQGTTIINTAGLGFNFTPSHAGSIYIDRMIFMANRSNNSSSLRADGGKLTVTNSVFFANESDYGTISTVADEFYFINNTVINNTYYTQFNGGDSRAGLLVGPYNDQVFIANNLLWDNYGHDVIASTLSNNDPEFYLYNNDYQSRSGVYDFESGNISEPPQLGFLNFTPDISSPLVDRGHHKPTIVPFPPAFEHNWSFGEHDFFSLDRVVNNKVDIGAVEALREVPIFVNGFEVPRGG